MFNRRYKYNHRCMKGKKLPTFVLNVALVLTIMKTINSRDKIVVSITLTLPKSK